MVHLYGSSSVCVIMCFLRTSARFMSTTMPSTLLTFMSAALSVYKVELVKKNSIFCVQVHHIAGITFWIRRWPIQTKKYCGLLSLIFNVYKIQLFEKEWPPMNTSTPPPSSLVGHLKVSLPVGCHLTHLDHPLGLFSSVRFQMPSKIACIWGCILTLVAFVWLFSTVCFQIFP